jgi:hypothetical protein
MTEEKERERAPPQAWAEFEALIEGRVPTISLINEPPTEPSLREKLRVLVGGKR